MNPFNVTSLTDECAQLREVADITAELLAGKLIDAPSSSPLSMFNDWVGLLEFLSLIRSLQGS